MSSKKVGVARPAVKSPTQRTAMRARVSGALVKSARAALTNVPQHVSWKDLTGHNYSELQALYPQLNQPNSLSTYLGLFYHPTCGGNPQAYRSGKVWCNFCSYEVAPASGEPLGTTLLLSEFRSKSRSTTFLY